MRWLTCSVARSTAHRICAASINLDSIGGRKMPMVAVFGTQTSPSSEVLPKGQGAQPVSWSPAITLPFALLEKFGFGASEGTRTSPTGHFGGGGGGARMLTPSHVMEFNSAVVTEALTAANAAYWLSICRASSPCSHAASCASCTAVDSPPSLRCAHAAPEKLRRMNSATVSESG
eukprot:189975-Pleurochrysis_carterae.AAC.4